MREFLRKEVLTMAKRMTWDEIARTYPDQWVGLSEVEWNGGGVRSAIVKYTDKSADELIGMQIEDSGDLYSTYTTPDNVPFIFSKDPPPEYHRPR